MIKTAHVPAFNAGHEWSRGVKVALQILILPVLVRIQARL